MRRIISVLLAATLMLVLAAPTSARPGAESWDRLNPFGTRTGEPEHERFTCLEGDVWRCRYDKLPEHQLDFSWDQTKGIFVGAAGGECPQHLLGDLCAHVTHIVTGTAVYRPWDGAAFGVPHQLLFTNEAEGLAPLYVHWVDQEFACPWHATWDDALGADPACFGT
jgi:hypothetical protein